MIQLYFLSILLNGSIGFLLAFADTEKNDTIESSMKFTFSSGNFRLIAGILAAIVGILKLLSPVGGQIPILGDLVPALANIAAGFIIVFGFYREQSSRIDQEGQLDRMGDIFLRYKKVASIALLAVAVLHFLFPTVMFL